MALETKTQYRLVCDVECCDTATAWLDSKELLLDLIKDWQDWEQLGNKWICAFHDDFDHEKLIKDTLID